MSQSLFLSNCTADAIAVAATKLASGVLVAFPTETVYGIGADAENFDAISRMYAVKNRPADHPVIVHIAELDDVDYWAIDVPEYAISLMRDYWPGPMTLLLKRSSHAKDFVTGNQEIVGLRMPAHTVALNLLKEFRKVGGHGVAAPSANRYGAVSPTTAEAARSELQEFLQPNDQILDGGACTVGVESTIIDCTGDAPRILRPGGITPEMIEESTGLTPTFVVATDADEIRVSGSLEKHYSPAAKVLLDQTPVSGQGFIAPSRRVTPTGVKRLAAPKNIDEFARDLYAALRKADELGLDEVVVEQPTGDGLAIAIRDRLLRASKGR